MSDAVRRAFDRLGALALVALLITVQASFLAGVAEARRPRMSDIVYPHGLAIDPLTGKTWITSTTGNDCRVYALGRAGVARHVAGNGSCTPSGDGGHARAAGLETPSRIAVSSTHVYVAGNTSVRRIERAHGGIGTFVGDPRYNCHLYGYSGPTAAVGRMANAVGISIGGMALNPVSGNLFVVNDCQHAIYEIDSSTGQFITKWFGVGTPIWALGEVAINGSGEIYFTSEPYQRTIYKVTGPSTAAHVAGTGSGGFSGNNGPATRATFDPVGALAFDGTGNLYIAAGSTYAHVMRVDTGGTLTTAIGIGGRGGWGGTATGRAGDMNLRSITALAVDPDDNVYVGSWTDTLVASIEAPFDPDGRWAWLMKDRLGVMEIERSGGRNPAIKNCDQACHGDPINTATGEYWEETSDMAIGGRGPAIDFVRSYGASNAGTDGPLGYGWSHPYAMSLVEDTDGYVTVRQENGSEIGFEPDGSGGFRATPGQFVTLVENGDGSYTLVRRQRETFHFTSDGRMTGIEDLNGYVTGLGYDGSGRLETITDEAGRTVTLTYDTSDRIVGLEDVAGRRVAYGYDSVGDLVSVTDVRGETWIYTYRDHLLLTRSDPNGHQDLENVYDPDGAVLSQEDGEGNLTRFEYLPGLTRTTSPEGRVTEYYYVGGQLIKKVEAAGTSAAGTWSYEYDLTTRGVTRTVDPRGNAWTATYNSAGLQISTRTPLGHTTATTYDGQGNRLTFRDPLTVTTTWTYDSGGNVLTRSVPVGTQTLVWRHAYGDASHPGDLTQLTDPLNKATSFAYDRYGNQTSIVDPTGAQTTTTYDLLGRRQTTVSPRGNEAGSNPADYTTSYAYDAAGNLLSQTDPAGDEQTSTFDRADNRATTTDEAGKMTRYGYDAADRLVRTTRADATELLNAYDDDGLLVRSTNGAGGATEYTHDARGRLASVTDPNGRVTTYDYNAAGDLTTVVDAARHTTTNTYDASNRLTGVAYSDGTTPGATFRYDAAGRRTGITDSTGTSTFTYDALGRLTQHIDGAARTIGYAYDAGSRMTSITYASGRAVTRTFDDAGRLTRVTDWLGNATAFDYDRDSHLTKTTFPSATGMEDVRSYDASGDLTNVTMKQAGATQASLAYGHDPRGLISSTTQTGLPGTGTLGYGYTDLAELAFENGDAYEHDAAGNLVRIAGVGPLDYDDAGQLLRGPVPPGSSSTDAVFRYDAHGSRIEATPVGGSTTTYAYDQAARLKAFTPPGGPTTTYASDGSGLRVSKATSGTTTQFTWDRSGSLPLLLGDGARSYVYGPGGPIGHITSGGAVRYYHQDALGSTRVLSDGTGTTVGAFSYTPYGTLAASSGTETAPMGYASEYTDAESGLQYLRARYYDPATGQFLTRDPLEDQTGQPYAYADGDPVNNVDPSGNVSISSAGMFISDAAAGALNEVTFGLSNRIAGVDGSCAGPGYAWGGRGGLAASMFSPAGMVRFGARRAAKFVASDGTEIVGFTRHGINRAIGDGANRAGVPPKALLDTIKNGTMVKHGVDDIGRPFKIYQGSDARVVVNPSTGRIVSMNRR
jgi:RHS repeat-associated protein